MEAQGQAAMVTIEPGAVLFNGKRIAVPGLTSFADAFSQVSELLSVSVQKVKEECRRSGGFGAKGGTIPSWRRRENPIIDTLLEVLNDQNFVHSCMTVDRTQFDHVSRVFQDAGDVLKLELVGDVSVKLSGTAATAAPKPKPKVVSRSELLRFVLAKVEELECLKNAPKRDIGIKVDKQVREIQAASCVDNGVTIDERELQFFERVVHACLALDFKTGREWPDASTNALKALAPSFGHIRLTTFKRILELEGRGLMGLHNIMQLVNSGELNSALLEKEVRESSPRHHMLLSMYVYDVLPEEVKLKNDCDIFIWAVTKIPSKLEPYKEDQNMVRLAINANPLALEHANEASQGNLEYLQYVLTQKPDFDLELKLKGGGEVVRDILEGARNFRVPVAEFALSRPRQILCISYLQSAEEPGYVNLCLSAVGGELLWGQDKKVPVTYAWRTTQGFREWWSNYCGDRVYDYAIITPEGKEGKMGEEVPLIDFDDLEKWKSIQHLKKTIRANTTFGKKMKERREKNKSRDEEGNDGKGQDEEGNDGHGDTTP